MSREEKEALLEDWNRTVGVSDYTALTTDTSDQKSMERLAAAEVAQLDLSRGVFPVNEALVTNHAALARSDAMEDPSVVARLRKVAETAARTYGNPEQWVTVTNQHRKDGFPEHEYNARVKGFAFAALRDNDVATAYAALHAADLLDDQEVAATVRAKVSDLERSDSPSDERALERMVRVFGSPQEKAA